jgi:hypothetical protein
MLACMTIPMRRSDLTARIVEGEVVILDRQTDHVHRLNATASYIWNRCDGRHTADAIASQLADEYNQPSEVVAQDVMATLENLRKLGLLAGDPTGSS